MADEWDNVFDDEEASDPDEQRARYALTAIRRLQLTTAALVRSELAGRPTKRARRAAHAEAHCLFRLVVGRVPNDDERAVLDKEMKR